MNTQSADTLPPSTVPVFQRWVVFDHTQAVNSDQLQRIVDALNEDNGPTGEYAKDLGRSACIRIGCFAEDGTPDRETGEYAIHIRQDLPEAPGALAYHTVTNGVPDIESCLALYDGITGDDGGSDPLSRGMDHEVKEALRNPGANGWKDSVNSNGRESADEACDKVQNTYRTASNGVWLSNYLLESAFIPGAPPPYDKLGVMVSQDDVSHGYDIQADAPGNVSEVFGDLHQLSSTVLAKGHRHVHLVSAKPITGKAYQRKVSPWGRAYRIGLRGLASPK